MLEDVKNYIVTPLSERQTQKSKSKVKSTCKTHPNIINGDREVLIYDVSQSEQEFIMGMIMLHELVKESGVPNYVGVRTLIFSGINYDFLEVELTDYDVRS